MDYEQQVRRASGGDVKAFVHLTRQFQHMVFGAALALVNDFHQAEDVVQEAFVAAWSALPSLADPAAFPGWLRGIVRRQAFRVLRKRTLRTVPLVEAEDLPGLILRAISEDWIRLSGQLKGLDRTARTAIWQSR
jgi:RNA polymerase sigma factor (sigma-70 family)